MASSSAQESTRPRPTDGTSATELQIFEATERVLSKASARDVSVAQILAEGSFARGTFYHYFSSKWDVINKLAATVVQDIEGRVALLVTADESIPRRDTLSRSIREGCAIWAEHTPVLNAMLEHWRDIPELGAMWQAALDEMRDAIAETIDHERAAGAAAPGVDSRLLANTLLWSTAQVLYIASLKEIDEPRDLDAARRSLLALWMGAIYGEPGAAEDQ